MAKNISIAGAAYPSVPSIEVPITGGGTATFYEDDECQTFYTGSSTPSASLGKNGDIYLKVVG